MNVGKVTTLQGLLRVNAAQRPDATAVIDTPQGGEMRRLTYRELDGTVAAVAGRLRELRLGSGEVVALQALNCAETVAAFFGILRAGCIPALVPVLWRHGDAAAALSDVHARALIAAPADDGTELAETALRTAAETFSVRHVLAFGESVPDGMVPLGRLAEARGSEGLAEADEAARRAVIITFETSQDGHVPLARTDKAFLAGGAAMVLEAGLARHAAVLGTMLPSSFAVLGTTMVPWLLTGGMLALHAPFDAEAFALLDRTAEADLVVVPGPVAEALAEVGIVGRRRRNTVAALWRSPELQQAAAVPWSGAARLLDVLAFGEAGFVALPRSREGRSARLKAGRVTAPWDNPDGLTVATLARSAAGTLVVSGPMAPRPFSDFSEKREPRLEEPIDTGYPCGLAADGTLTLSGPPPGLVSIGGYRFAIEDLRAIVRRIAPESVLAALPDVLAGQKLAGAAADIDRVRSALAEHGANPLVGAAFRDRRAG